VSLEKSSLRADPQQPPQCFASTAEEAPNPSVAVGTIAHGLPSAPIPFSSGEPSQFLPKYKPVEIGRVGFLA
jgi:hypothetical protein